MFQSKVKETQEVVVFSVVSKEKSKPRPQALNTVELMRTASSGMSVYFGSRFFFGLNKTI